VAQPAPWLQPTPWLKWPRREFPLPLLLLDLHLLLPTAPRNGNIERAGREAAEALQAALQSLLDHGAILQPGRVFCLRCGSARCPHAAPAESRQVFAGYGPTGLPRFQDFGQWLLARRDPRVDLLYREPPQLVTVAVPGRELARQLLPAFLDREDGYRLHGEVAAGWFRDRDATGERPLAVTFQVVSSRSRGARRRFGLNVIGAGPGGEPLANLWDRTGETHWAEAVRWAQEALEGIERSFGKQAGKESGKAAGKRSARDSGRNAGEALERRLEGLLGGLARRLERNRRGQERRTRHGERRHREGDRPTGMALADLARAGGEDLLVDVRRGTLSVVGERGRAHVFSPAGKLVTSVRYTPAAIEKRRQRGLWRPAGAEELERLRASLEAAASAD
jgi:hypothetical protein